MWQLSIFLLHQLVNLYLEVMLLSADESRSIVIVGAISMNTTRFYVTEPSTPSDHANYIPSMHSVSVKFLVKSVMVL